MKKSPFLGYPSAKLTNQILSFFILYFLIVSCNKNETASTSGIKSEKTIISQIIEQRNLNQEKYLFMDFWDRMNEGEYRFILDSLIKNEHLYKRSDSVFCKLSFFGTETTISDMEFHVVPSFNNNRLFQISLISKKNSKLLMRPSPLIDTFTKKYGSPLNKQNPFEENEDRKEDMYYEFETESNLIEIEVRYTQVIWGTSTYENPVTSYMLEKFKINYSNKSTIELLEQESIMKESQEKKKIMDEIKAKAEKSYNNI